MRDGFLEVYLGLDPRRRQVTVIEPKARAGGDMDEFSKMEAAFEKSRMAQERETRFSYIFEKKVRETADVVEMVTNLKYINHLLMGVTHLFATNLKLAETRDSYYEKDKIKDAVDLIDV